MLEALSNNKFFLGVALLLLNVGSRHLVDEFSTDPDEYSRNLVLRRLAIFAVCFVGTRDIVVSVVLTAAFVILAQGVSRRSREGMATMKETMKSELQIGYPAADPDVKPLFTT